jgi:hypothetical protein
MTQKNTPHKDKENVKSPVPCSCPQDQMLYHFLIQKLQLSLTGPQHPLEGLATHNTLLSRIEELQLATLLLDILLAALQDSDCISDKIQAR